MSIALCVVRLEARNGQLAVSGPRGGAGQTARRPPEMRELPHVASYLCSRDVRGVILKADAPTVPRGYGHEVVWSDASRDELFQRSVPPALGRRLWIAAGGVSGAARW
jgi:hypothetical protein